MNLGRVARTVARLHPLQVATRAPHRALQAALRVVGVPGGHGPALRGISPHALMDALDGFARAERARWDARGPRLRNSPRLAAYEAHYGYDLDAVGDDRDATAREPYVASVRARRVASAIARGRHELLPTLVGAARAAALGVELHLLGNHVLENGLGLTSAASVTRGAESDVWWALGSALLDWQLGVQFQRDGSHFEGSMSYHLALVAGLLEAITLADLGGRPVPSAWRDAAQRALDHAARFVAPDGTYPLFNDASLDAGPLPAVVFALAHARGMRAHVDAAPTALSPDAGWVALRSDRTWLAFKCGPDGADEQPGHVHADLLTFELWADGARAVVDYGVSSYADTPARHTSRATRVHNTVTVDDRDSSEVWSAFRCGRRARGVLHALTDSRGARTATASHLGYAWMPGTPEHHRTLTLTDDTLTVDDRVDGAAGHACVSRLRLDARAAVRVTPEVDAADDVWYPRFDDATPARTYAQRLDARGVGRWVVALNSSRNRNESDTPQ